MYLSGEYYAPDNSEYESGYPHELTIRILNCVLWGLVFCTLMEVGFHHTIQDLLAKHHDALVRCLRKLPRWFYVVSDVDPGVEPRMLWCVGMLCFNLWAVNFLSFISSTRLEFEGFAWQYQISLWTPLVSVVICWLFLALSRWSLDRKGKKASTADQPLPITNDQTRPDTNDQTLSKSTEPREGSNSSPAHEL
ncbi:hypothetical protein F5Y16DRAFT_256336 [Xylariaceae sp. FL0255]|nr:hypothetical protein F5Y16DRAFT_256336 [Xylariaceae sp. FL0255]